MKLDTKKNLVINYTKSEEETCPPIVLFVNSRMWTEFLITFGPHFNHQPHKMKENEAATVNDIINQMKAVYSPTVSGCMPFNS